ncbi:MAG: RimK family alpha-L-glutamate ligase [Saprospiraceae bacterium]
MNILVLSRNKHLYSTKSIVAAGEKRGHQMIVIDYTECNLIVESGDPHIYYRGVKIEGIDAIIPRIGSSNTFFGASVVRQFEAMGVYTLTSSQGLLASRDKLHCIQVLSQEGVQMPKTIFPSQFFSMSRVEKSIGMPCVIKLLSGTHGIGVILVESRITAESIIETFIKQKQQFVVQEFISEAGGSDVRTLVVDGEIVAAMRRTAQSGDFRSNLHRGASSEIIEPSAEMIRTALNAVNTLGLEVAGVDILQSRRGPLLLEVNASPGLEGIETTTGIDVAGKMIETIEERV